MFTSDPSVLDPFNGANFSHLHFYLARLYKPATAGDDRVTVRIVPFMNAYKSDQTAALPKYPMLFKGTTVAGKSEVESKENATLLICLCNDDFSVGWVVCRAQRQTLSYSKEPLYGSYEYKTVKELLTKYGVTPTDSRYENLEVMYQNNSRTLFFMASGTEPAFYIMNSLGSTIAMNGMQIALFASSGTDSKSKVSSMRITPTAITFSTDGVFDIQKAQSVVLGHSGANLVGTASSGRSTASDSWDLQNINTILV